VSVTTARQDICDTLAEALDGTTWYPKRPGTLRPDTGWLVLTGLTSEGCTHGELAVSFNAILVLGSNEAAASEAVDDRIILFHEAFRGWARTVSSVVPAEVPVDDNVLFTLVATFQMEVGTT